MVKCTYPKKTKKNISYNLSKKLNNQYLCLIESCCFDKYNFDYYLAQNSFKFSKDETDSNKVLTKDFWENNTDIEKHKKEAKLLYSSVIQFLAEALNSIHNENQSIIYWERVLGIWTWFYVTNYLEKYKRLDYVFKRKPNLTAISINSNGILPASSTLDYIDSLRNSEISHLQQYSLILQDFFKNNFKKIHLNSIKNKSLSYKRKYTLKNILINITQKIIGRGYFSGEHILFATRFSNKNLFKLFLLSRFKIRPIFKTWYKKPEYSFDINLRKKISIKNSQNLGCEIQKSIINNIYLSIPLEVIEGYKDIKSEIDIYIAKNVPKKIITGIGFTLDTKFAIWAASCAEKGSFLYGCQHGGLYGDTNMIADEYFERKLTNEYISWGWSDNFKITNKLSSQIFSDRKIFRRDPQKLLWVMTLDSRYSYSIEEMLVGERFYKYFKNQRKFYDKLAADLKKNLLIRTYPNDFNWKINNKLDYCKEYFVNTSETSFIDNLKKSKLVIVDHIGGTTTLECASSSIPFIIISDKRDSNFRESALEIHKKLHEVKILFYDYEEAAKYIETIYDDINKWWNDEYRQEIFNEYRKTYVKTDKNFLNEWNNFLLK